MKNLFLYYFKNICFFIIVKGYWDILLIQYGALIEYLYIHKLLKSNEIVFDP